MARLNNLWFEFGGVSSATRSLKLKELPTRKRPALRVKDNPIVPGRDGSHWQAEDGYDDIEIPVRVQLLLGASIRTINAWLTGRGWLRFSDEPTMAYKARALKAYEIAHTEGQPGMQTIEVVFVCSPLAYVYPLPTATLTNGGSITNPSSRYAEPVITVIGSGDIALTIGSRTLSIAGLQSKIVIDSEARTTYNPDDPDENTNLLVSREDWPFVIDPGVNAVSWTGAVTSATAILNWRYL